MLPALSVGGLATMTALDRDRAFYPTVPIVIASDYVLFAVMGASGRTLGIEIAAASGFMLLALIGFKRSLWLVAAGLVGHGVFDFRPSCDHREPRSAKLVARVLSGV